MRFNDRKLYAIEGNLYTVARHEVWDNDETSVHFTLHKGNMTPRGSYDEGYGYTGDDALGTVDWRVEQDDQREDEFPDELEVKMTLQNLGIRQLTPKESLQYKEKELSSSLKNLTNQKVWREGYVTRSREAIATAVQRAEQELAKALRDLEANERQTLKVTEELTEVRRQLILT